MSVTRAPEEHAQLCRKLPTDTALDATVDATIDDDNIVLPFSHNFNKK